MYRHCLIFLLFILLPINTIFANASNWNKSYKEINADIALARRVKKKDLSLNIQLFELYSEKFFLLMEKESEYELKALDHDVYMKKLVQIRNIKRSTFNQLTGLGKKLLAKISNPDMKSKIYYILALHNENLKNNRQFEYYMLKADRGVKSVKVAKKIKVKLAEQYYNTKQYKKALSYYDQVLKLPADDWTARHMYNRSWCYLKVNNTPRALHEILNSYEYNKKHQGMNLGRQHIDSILLFFAINKRTKDGLRFLEKEKINDFENLIKYLHLTFENGNKQDSILIIRELDDLKKTKDQNTELLTKKMLVYRTLNDYNDVRKTIVEASKYAKNRILGKNGFEELVKSIEGFSGLLQEKIKHSNFLKMKNKDAYMDFADKNFLSLTIINPKRKIYYHWMRGETFLSIRKYDLALKRYRVAIDEALDHKSLPKSEEKLVKNVFDSYFTTVDKMDKKNSRKNEDDLIFGYKAYLKLYPKTKLAKEILRRYINLLINKDDVENSVAMINYYNKVQPKELNEQRGFFRTLVNKSINKEDIGKVNYLLKYLKADFLTLKKSDYERVLDISHKIQFREFEQQEKKSPQKAVDGYISLFGNKAADRELKIKALHKILKVYESLDFNKIPRWTAIYLNYSNKNELKVEKERVEYYIQKICLTPDYKTCEKNIVSYKSKVRNVSKIFDSFLYESLLLQKKYDGALSFLIANKKSFGPSEFEQKRLTYLNSIILLNPSDMLKHMKKLLKINFFHDEVTNIIKTYALNAYFYQKDASVLKDRDFKFLAPEWSKISWSEKEIKNISRIPLVKLSDEEINFEKFSKELGTVSTQVTNFISRVDSFFSKNGDPRLGHRLYDYAIKYLEKTADVFEHYYPMTKDAELQKAVKGELIKISLIYRKKAIEYQGLNKVLLKKLNDDSGSRNEYYQLNSGVPWQNLFVIQTGV